MEGYSRSEYTEFREDEDEDDWDPTTKKRVKYTILKEEDFIDEEE
jgi:predicted NUDIX family phosphoesterase